MKKGMAIIEVNDTEVKGIQIEQEVLEFARLNAKTKKHVAKVEEKKAAEDQSRRKAEKAEARRKAYTIHTIKDILCRCGVVVALAMAGVAKLVHPAICIPVSVYCLCTACLRFGIWFGRSGK